MNDTKIFIDTDEEITFIAEKIKQAPTKNVVVIVPDRASVFITSASLRLLKKSIDRLDKKVVLVTMDEVQKKMSEDLGITTVYRVKDVTDDIWDKVSKFKPVKKDYSKQAAAVEVTIPEPEDPAVESQEEVEEQEPEKVLPNLSKFEFKSDQEEVAEQEPEVVAPQENITEKPEEVLQNLPELHADTEEIQAEEKFDEFVKEHPLDPDFIPNDSEPENPAQEMEMIAEEVVKNPEIIIDEEQPEVEIPAKEFEIEPTHENIEPEVETITEPIEESISEPEKKDSEFVFLMGKDIAKEMQKKNSRIPEGVTGSTEKFFSEDDTFSSESDLKQSVSFKEKILLFINLIKEKLISVWNWILNYVSTVKSRFKNSPKGTVRRQSNNSSKINSTSSRNSKQNPIKGFKFNKRFLYVGGVVFVIFLLVFWWWVYQFAPSMTIYAQKQSVSISKQQDIIANFNSTDGIKAFVQTQTVSGSDSADTTGTGKVGTAAAGVVRTTYLQASGSITLKTGQIVTCVNLSDCGGKPLNFKITKDVTLSLATSPVDVSLQASDIGPDYNLNSGIKFKATGVAESDLSMTNLSPFTGGDSRDIRNVAQADYDNLKNKLTDELKQSAQQKIIDASGPNTVILTDKLKVEVKNVVPDKQVGAEADRINMNMDVVVTASAYDKTTVTPYVQNLLRQEEHDNLKLDLTSIDVKQNVKSSDDTSITITLICSGILRPSVDPVTIANDLKGKPLDEVEKYLNNIPNVKFSRYAYEPSWAPGFLKHVPNGAANIIIEIQDLAPKS